MYAAVKWLGFLRICLSKSAIRQS